MRCVWPANSKEFLFKKSRLIERLQLTECFPSLEKALLEEIQAVGKIALFLPDQHVVKQGQFIRHLPIVLSGSIKVYSMEETIQFLLYYISSGEACVFSFAHIYNSEAVAFSAVAEQESELLLLPFDKLSHWLKTYPSFSALVLKDYQKQYTDLLHTTKQITCYNLEERLLKYLHTKTEIEQSDLLKTSHQDIADDLGTSREVITRLMKKLNANGKVLQQGRSIKVL